MEYYELLQVIGKGSFGLVHKVKKLVDGKLFACKELNYGTMSEREKQQLVSEVNILRDLDHPNIVKYYERIIDKKNTKIYLIMEFCPGGDLSQLLRKCKKEKDYIAEDVVWKVFAQLCVALNDCHNRQNNGRILHRDIKPANVFLDEQNNIKLGDFGLARILGENSVFCKTHVGTPYYMSPEQINEVCYDEKCDIWSCGCLLYELAALHPPFEATNHLSLAIKIKTGKFERLPLRYSEDIQNLVETMLNIDPKQRPNITDLLNLPQISLRVKERKLRDRHCQVKFREEALRLKEEQLVSYENELKTKENMLSNQIARKTYRYSQPQEMKEKLPQ